MLCVSFLSFKDSIKYFSWGCLTYNCSMCNVLGLVTRLWFYVLIISCLRLTLFILQNSWFLFLHPGLALDLPSLLTTSVSFPSPGRFGPLLSKSSFSMGLSVASSCKICVEAHLFYPLLSLLNGNLVRGKFSAIYFHSLFLVYYSILSWPILLFLRSFVPVKGPSFCS